MHRFPYTQELTAEDLDLAIRQQIPLLKDEQVCLADAEGACASQPSECLLSSATSLLPGR